jgi:hypothetical protein
VARTYCQGGAPSCWSSDGFLASRNSRAISSNPLVAQNAKASSATTPVITPATKQIAAINRVVIGGLPTGETTSAASNESVAVDRKFQRTEPRFDPPISGGQRPDKGGESGSVRSGGWLSPSIRVPSPAHLREALRWNWRNAVTTVSLGFSSLLSRITRVVRLFRLCGEAFPNDQVEILVKERVMDTGKQLP